MGPTQATLPLRTGSIEALRPEQRRRRGAPHRRLAFRLDVPGHCRRPLFEGRSRVQPKSRRPPGSYDYRTSIIFRDSATFPSIWSS